jgi:hypothetical protein
MSLHRRICRSTQLVFEIITLHRTKPSIRYLSSGPSECSMEPSASPTESGPVGSFTLESASPLDLEIPSQPLSTLDTSMLSSQLEMYDLKQQVYSAPSPDGSHPRPTLSLGAFPINAQPKEALSTATYRDEIEELMNDEPHDESPTAPPDPAEYVEKSHPMRDVKELDLEIQANHSELVKLLKNYREKSEDVPLDRIFELYYSLPSPRVCYLTRFNVRRILTILSRQNNLLSFIANRYFIVIKDMQLNQTRIRRTEWSGMIDAIGKSNLFDPTIRLDLATQALFDMDQTGIKANAAILTSLLQTAVLHENWSIAHLIDDEIRKRKLETVIVWTERIKIAGRQQDVDKIHQTFRDFCESGIPVDIVFVNALLEAFFNANRPDLAEIIYLRLQTFVLTHYKGTVFPAKRSKVQIRKERMEFISRGESTRERTLEWELAKRRIDPADLLDETGAPTPTYEQTVHAVSMTMTPHAAMLIPQNATIRAFITYHCHYTGRMEDVAFYLNEMDRFNIEPLYGTYADLLHGFFLWHKRSKETPWNKERLRNIFSLIQKGILEGKPTIPIKYVIALTSIRAFGKVEGGKGAREVWDFLRPWLVLNENVRERKLIAHSWLEQLVKKFEAGENLGPEMSGGDARWRVKDWRKN